MTGPATDRPEVESLHEALIRAAQTGDREAFAGLAESLARPFLGASRRILRDIDLAEDATQEALVGIWHGLPKLRDVGRFEAWAHRILVRACQAQADRARTRGANIRGLPTEVPDPADDLRGVLDREQLERAFQRLSIEHRTAIVLRYFLDLPLDATAEALGIPEGTASSRLHYAIQELRTAVEADARPMTREGARER